MGSSITSVKSTNCGNCAMRHVGLCHMAGDEAQSALAQISTLHDHSANSTVRDSETPPDTFSVLVSGYLRLQRFNLDGRRQILSLFVPGDILGGELTRHQGDTVEASTDARICQFDRRQYRQFAEQFPEVGRAIYHVLGAQVERLHMLTWSLGVQSPEERICAFLASATQYMPFVPCGDGGILTVDLPRPDIADLLGTSLETISRITNALDAAGLLRIRNPHEFEIPKLAELARRGGLGSDLGARMLPSGLARRVSIKLKKDRIAAQRHTQKLQAGDVSLASRNSGTAKKTVRSALILDAHQ